MKRKNGRLEEIELNPPPSGEFHETYARNRHTRSSAHPRLGDLPLHPELFEQPVRRGQSLLEHADLRRAGGVRWGWGGFLAPPYTRPRRVLAASFSAGFSTHIALPPFGKYGASTKKSRQALCSYDSMLDITTERFTRE